MLERKRKSLTSDFAVKNAKCEDGKNVTRFSCGGLGVYLDVKKKGARSFILCMMVKGKRYERGLGSYPHVSLAEAREKGIAVAKKLLAGEPVGKRAEKAAASKCVTFEEAATRYLEYQDRAGNFKPALFPRKYKGKITNNSVHRIQWDQSLKDYVYEHIGHIDVGAIRIEHMNDIFDPIWKSKYATAKKTRQRIALVLDYAVEQGWRSEDLANPAKHKSTKFVPPKRRETRHHPAIDKNDMPVFMRELRALNSVSAYALELTILTGVRTTETRAAKWDEIDFESQMWIIPELRMKANKAHRVPLSDRAIALLKNVYALRGAGDWVFPSRGSCLSNMAQYACLKGLRSDATVHGFRSTFRDWAVAERVDPEVRAACSAHSVEQDEGKKKDMVRAAYERNDFYELRVPVMQAWADFLA